METILYLFLMVPVGIFIGCLILGALNLVCYIVGIVLTFVFDLIRLPDMLEKLNKHIDK